jgi:phenylpropionate dioxygenase-like ring-hydroxylating dioxygenase large terminal subunit
VFRQGWSCAGVVDDVAGPNAYSTATVGGLPVLLTRTFDGELRGFLNVCRHRGAPLVEGCGTARALGCPYHGWVYRLDGGLARAVGLEETDVDVDALALYPVQVATWARFVFVNPDVDAAPLDLGPLAGALDPFPLADYELAVREQHDREFNWKVFVENYSENFHTPFVHPELIVNGWDYPIVSAGELAVAWDRPLEPRNQAEDALAAARPGAPGWSEVAACQIEDVFIAGVYVTAFPNLLVSAFPRYLSALHVTPLGPIRTRVQAYRFWTPDVPAERRHADLAASRVVAAQDLDICERVQRGYTAGIDTDGRLSAHLESGVRHVHELVAGRLKADAER